jgi:methylated-DNA-[protein]-cysteine S-methyltransferase
MSYQTLYASPLGNLLIEATDDSLTKIEFDGNLIDIDHPNTVIHSTILQLEEYFNKKRKIFDLQLSPQGTDFQKSVWDHLSKIPFGQQISYSQLSRQLKNPLAIRAIAAANGKNPIPIIIPCHRVVGSKGELVGFSGGLWRKQFLLELEGNVLF